ncbi:acyl-CoA N-acyltransferase [Hypoxylon sp. FL0543]|nr:acyl-CoA N-acyltransferase [Hypoxylon sp. FL0543]
MATARVAGIVTTPQVPSEPTSEVTIGDALVSDAAAIALIGANTFTVTFGSAVPDNELADFLATTYSAEAIEAELARARESNISTFVARDEAGAVLGFVQLVRGVTEPCLQGDASTHAELRRLYVDVSAHGRGVGSKLIAAVESKAKAEGFQTLWLAVWENSTKAQRLYQKLGYAKVGETDFTLGECVHTDWVLAKSL